MVKKKARRARGNRETTGEQLLDSAAALMAEWDTIDVPLAEVAERAGVNIALVKYYFGNREGLLMALAVRDSTLIVREFNALVAMTDLSAVEKLRRHITGQVLIYWRFPYLDALLRALMRDTTSETARTIANDYIGPICAAQAQLLTEAQAAGDIRDISPASFYFATSGACHYLFAARATLDNVFGVARIDAETARGYARDVAGMIMDGLATHAST
ncbi:TetR family transcriptional regulator [Altererythrobacter sp. Z27]|uniref:TetR family transcriptional regulator n=1 Tax=Altererythrobacter sp. Z27 TaxID=3461147 RepID=UPI0040440FDF